MGSEQMIEKLTEKNLDMEEKIRLFLAKLFRS